MENNSYQNNNINPERLFVYGSLMEGFFNYYVLKDFVISRTYGKVKGLLYHQNYKGYPAIVSGNGWVVGEYLELKYFYECLSVCDKLEEYFGPKNPNNFYERRICDVELLNGKTSLAWIYWYIRNDLNSLVNPATLIPNGDWRNFVQ